MKLRIAHVDDNRRMAGKFAVQIRTWGTWNNMYFDSGEKVLLEEFELGRPEIAEAVFDDFHEAMKYARIFKQKSCYKQVIRETWRV